jgi:hypothetical protein
MILATEETEFRTIMVEVLSREIIQETPCWKHPTANRAGGVEKQEEHLPSKHGALMANPSVTDIKNKLREYIRGK